MKFENINHIILFGGSRCCAELANHLKLSKEYQFNIFTCKRQLDEKIYQNGVSLKDYFLENQIDYISSEDIKNEPKLNTLISENTLGIGIGEAWTFSKDIITKFKGRLLDLMGQRLPHYRGGAHYTWQILRKNKIGSCNLQVINEHMVQGVFDSGKIIKTKEYFFPATVRIPNDYFNTAVNEEINFIKEFLDEVKNKTNFEIFSLQENFSIYFPRLNTAKHGFIDWNWETEYIERFICAFDEPYIGASTFINGLKVQMKNCYTEYNDGAFHPFQAGLIYKIYNNSVFIASKAGTVIVHKVINESKENIIPQLKTGQRFYTKRKYLDKSMEYSIDYSSGGIKEKPK
jgi:methionyl-tRNA formyltransferase